jgi:hypothetical protein
MKLRRARRAAACPGRGRPPFGRGQTPLHHVRLPPMTGSGVSARQSTAVPKPIDPVGTQCECGPARPESCQRSITRATARGSGLHRPIRTPKLMPQAPLQRHSTQIGDPRGPLRRQSGPVPGGLRGVGTSVECCPRTPEGCRHVSRLPCGEARGVPARQSTPVRGGPKGACTSVDSRAGRPEGYLHVSRLPCGEARGVPARGRVRCCELRGLSAWGRRRCCERAGRGRAIWGYDADARARRPSATACGRYRDESCSRCRRLPSASAATVRSSPPRRTPRTKTWGNVGQPLHSLMASRFFQPER